MNVSRWQEGVGQLKSEGDISSLLRAEALLKAVGNAVRIRIVCLLYEHGPRCVYELTDELGLRQPLVSQHLRSLRSVGVVIGEREGREVRYRLADDHVWHIVNDAIKHSDEKRR